MVKISIRPLVERLRKRTINFLMKMLLPKVDLAEEENRPPADIADIDNYDIPNSHRLVLVDQDTLGVAVAFIAAQARAQLAKRAGGDVIVTVKIGPSNEEPIYVNALTVDELIHLADAADIDHVLDWLADKELDHNDPFFS